MTPLRFLLLSVLVCSLHAQTAPARVIQPVLEPVGTGRIDAMRAAPIIAVIEINGAELMGDMQNVAKPIGTAGPQSPTIPLHLARIQAKTLLAIRGAIQEKFDFYSWVWASGSHGGPRLFNVSPGSVHLLFLKPEGAYLHTVGDYPNYDLTLWPQLVPGFLSSWNASPLSDPFERYVTARLNAEFDSVSNSDVGGPTLYYAAGITDLIELVGPRFVATQLAAACRSHPNAYGRFAACVLVGERFRGMRMAYRLADPAGPWAADLDAYYRSCRGYSANEWFQGVNLAPEHRRETMRVYASAMDPDFQYLACLIAATIPEARGIPECR